MAWVLTSEHATCDLFWLCLVYITMYANTVNRECILDPSVSVCIWVWVWMAKWQFGYTKVIQITIWSFTLKNINIFYFEMCSQIAIELFSIKKAWQFLNSQMAVWPCTSHLAIHTQTQAQTESEAFKTHLKKSVTPVESKNQKQEHIVDRTDIRCGKTIH